MATSVGDFALFGGGLDTSGVYVDVVDTYDASLTKNIATQLSVGRRNGAAASVGNYAMFGGGEINSTPYSAVVDVYTVV